MGDYIKKALLSDHHHKKLKDESKHLVDKWDKTGLLEGLDRDYDKSGMAIILENQAVIKLPSNNYLYSLENFLSINEKSIFDKYKIFDYRIRDQLILN